MAVARLIVPALCLAALGCSSGFPKPVLSSVHPAQVARAGGATLQLEGSGFAATVKADFDHPELSQVDATYLASLEGPNGSVSLDDVSLLGPTTLGARVPAGVPLATYDVAVVDPRGARAVLSQALAVVDCVACVCDATTVSYLDSDGDGVGNPDAGVLGCPDVDAGRVAVGNDCDDDDPFTFPGAPELCDGRDNNCDGRIDEGAACPSDAGWGVRADLAGGDDWRAVATATGSVWLASASGRVVLRDSTGPFTDVSGNCTGAWATAWPGPKGVLYLGGGARDGGTDGVLATHDPAQPSCGQPVEVAAGPVTGLVGFGKEGNLDVYGVTATGNTFVWSPKRGDLSALPALQATLTGIHGASLLSLFAVGGTASHTPRVYQYISLGQRWDEQSLPNGTSAGTVRDVWVVSDGLAFAVGEGGAFWRWDGVQGWRALASVGNVTLTAVRAFSKDEVYAVDAAGYVRRYDGDHWNVLWAPGAGAAQVLNAIAGTAPGDLWVAGSGGLVLHWPE